MIDPDVRWPKRKPKRRRRLRRRPVHTRNRAIQPVATADSTFKAAADALDRSGVASDIDARIRNPKRQQPTVSTEAWLVAATIELGATGSYERSRVWARIKGLTAAQQRRVKLPGLRTRTISYDACEKQALRVERAVDEADSDRGWDWFALRVLAGPRMIRDRNGNWTDPAAAATDVALDDTPYFSWARRRGPNPTAQQDAAGIRTAGPDPDARNGYRTPTRLLPEDSFYGYQVVVVVTVPPVHWYGNPNQIRLGDYVPPYIVHITVRPANADPGPAGHDAVVRARAVAAINNVIADMGFTMKTETFVDALHDLGVNVVMSLPPNDIARVDTHLMGRRKDPVIENAGTFFHPWLPPEWEHVPEDLVDTERRDWYARRLIYAYTTHQRLQDGAVQIKNPFGTGRLTTDESAASATGALYVTKPAYAPDAQQTHLTLPADKLGRHQREPYGTRAWWLSYLRRLIVETANARLKSNAGLSNKCCKAMGNAAHTMSAILLAVAYNLDIAHQVKQQARRDHGEHEEQPADTAHHSDSGTAAPDRHDSDPESEPPERSPP